VFKENNFSFIDVKSDIPDEYDDNIEKIFIKL
jgi:hypothetical protein